MARAVGRHTVGLGTQGLRTLVFVLYPLLGAVVAVLSLVGESKGLDGFQLFNDPAHQLGVLWGVFSYFGILMWAMATACCTVGWAFLRETSPSLPLRRWFLTSALISGALTIDDTFAVHERIVPEYVGLAEPIVLLIYVVVVAWYLVRFRHELFGRSDSTLFLASLVFLSVSLLIDVTGWVFPFVTAIEDLSKLLGITAWLHFFFRATIEATTEGGLRARTRRL
ncbi:MAG: hypothetical protein ACRDLB_01745 [Actinomycetota bacterium]